MCKGDFADTVSNAFRQIKTKANDAVRIGEDQIQKTKHHTRLENVKHKAYQQQKERRQNEENYVFEAGDVLDNVTVVNVGFSAWDGGLTGVRYAYNDSSIDYVAYVNDKS